jgi:hypothetical protein
MRKIWGKLSICPGLCYFATFAGAGQGQTLFPSPLGLGGQGRTAVPDARDSPGDAPGAGGIGEMVVGEGG